jgi:hypothetical protein
MGYSQAKGRRPFERASKIAHTEVLNNKVVQAFVNGCILPDIPAGPALQERLQQIPAGDGRVKTVIAIDGGMTEVPVRKEFPSASIAFMTLGPLLMSLQDLAEVDRQPFIGPEDMAKFKNIHRYTAVVPVKGVRAPGAKSFAMGVRQAVHNFLAKEEPELLKALQWLLFREWLSSSERKPWRVGRCPSSPTGKCEFTFEFESGQPIEQQCPGCDRPVYLSDGLRLYERIDEELGASGIMAYLLTTLEQLILVHLIRSILNIKPALLREILFVKDGPLAFFGVTSPLRKPMRELMHFLGTRDDGKPLVNLVGLEKSGPFVEHAVLIEPLLKPGQMLVLDNDYIYKYIQPGDPDEQAFGFNTYYGAKVIFKGEAQDTYVATVPTASYTAKPRFEDLFNGAEVLSVTSQLRCSMYDNALVPIVLANRLVSLADVPSSEILAKFAAKGIKTTGA